MKTFKEKLDENKLATARACFSGYVQSVAFNMTLSRHMVDALYAVRDYGGCRDAKEAVSPHVNTHTAPLMTALMRRGLVWHDYIEPKMQPVGHKYWKLTRAGELMCELLVEAGLIPAEVDKMKRKRG